MLSIQHIIIIAGLAQIVLVVASFAIPKVLGWKTELLKVQPLIKQMFWTYAAYILVINLCFGLISTFDAVELLNGTTLAILVTGFMAAYWISRVFIQFLYFDRSNFPPGKLNQFFEIMLVLLFIFLSAIYSWACFLNFNHI